MKKFENILITGITGLIGGIVFNDLKKDYQITGLSRRKMDAVKHFQANVDNLEEIIAEANKDKCDYIQLYTHKILYKTAKYQSAGVAYLQVCRLQHCSRNTNHPDPNNFRLRRA